MFAGHDSRLAMEQNLGATEVGVQTSIWLYLQTKTLVEEYKVNLTLCGDQPFVMRLVYGDNVEDDCKCALYVGKSHQLVSLSKTERKLSNHFCNQQLILTRRTTSDIPWQLCRQPIRLILAISEEFALTLAMVLQEGLRMTYKSFATNCFRPAGKQFTPSWTYSNPI